MLVIVIYCFFFFFSSRRRHTRWTGDWSSDVCSSDLSGLLDPDHVIGRVGHLQIVWIARCQCVHDRSEERREGKSVDLGGRRIIKKKKKKKTIVDRHEVRRINNRNSQ